METCGTRESQGREAHAGDEIGGVTAVCPGQGQNQSRALKCHEPNFADPPEKPQQSGG